MAASMSHPEGSTTNGETPMDDDEANAQSVISRKSSITHPYRALVEDVSFPRCNVLHQPGGNSESFVRSIFPQGHGFPLWNPNGLYPRPEPHFQNGISIGDVGILTAFGNFKFFFNIFLPTDSEGQAQPPPGFKPLSMPKPEDLIIDEATLHRGFAITSEGISLERLSETPLELKFTVKGREGAAVVLPEGAVRGDLTPEARKRLLEYAKKHVFDWYKSIMEPHEELHPNGSLYIVTGTDKANHWALACSPASYSSAFTGQTFDYKQVGGSESPWLTAPNLRVKSDARSNPRGPVCAVFIRGMRFALSSGTWIKHLLQNEPPETIPYVNILDTQILGYQARRLTERQTRLQISPKLPSHDAVVFHPLDLVQQVILQRSSGAKMSVLDDYMLFPLLNKHNLTLSEIIPLLVRLLDTHNTVVEESLVTLAPRTKSLSYRTFFNNPFLHVRSALKTWKQHQENFRDIARLIPGPGLG